MSDKSLAAINKNNHNGLPSLPTMVSPGGLAMMAFEALGEAAEVFAVARLLVALASFVTRGR
jgi:hypothetical protein